GRDRGGRDATARALPPARSLKRKPSVRRPDLRREAGPCDDCALPLRVSSRRRESASGSRHLDGYGDGVADRVAYGRVAREPGKLGQLVVVEVAGGLEGDPDLLEAGPYGLVEAEEALQVRVALDRAFQAFEHDPAGGGVVDDRAGQAGGEGLKEVFARIGAPGLAAEDRRLVRIQDKRLRAARVLVAGAVEPFDRGAVVAAVDPLVASPELKLRERRLGGDVLDRPCETIDVDAVDDVRDLHG